MQIYQIRLLDNGGRGFSNHTRVCEDDYEAMSLAKNLVDGGGIAHIWQGARSVGQIFLPLPTAAD